jgi:IclR family mhp operon transcriptional activator
MAGPKTIRALERGLQVLVALQSNPISSLQDVHAATGIAKPTLLRILRTLESGGLVARRLVDRRYRLSGLRRPARKRDRFDAVAEAAAPVLYRLCRQVLWPSDLLVPAGTHMERRETSRSHSPFPIHPAHEMNQVGQPVGWLLSAVGRAYLAYCSEKERARILRKLRKTGKVDDRLAHDPKRLEKILMDTRRRGYGTRDAGFVGGFYDAPPHDDGLAAIAVPLVDGARVHGSINILFIRTAFSVEEFAARHLGALQAAACEIVAALYGSASGPPDR